ncbi:MAG: hypothetical protein CMK89_00370 [Pseudomonadales bacterium]|mgnify:CR=1 FL=1|nr:hypothetical protein [Pseudomonadales bacterium]
MMLNNQEEMVLLQRMLNDLFVGIGNDDAEAKNKSEFMAERLRNLAQGDKLREAGGSELSGLGFINSVTKTGDNIYVNLAIRSGMKPDADQWAYENYRCIVLSKNSKRFFENLIGDNVLDKLVCQLVIGNPRATLNTDKSEIWRSGILKSWSIHN